MDPTNEDFAMLLPCTQEDIPIGWDWNSPKPKRERERPRKRPASTQPPKVTLKRHSSSHALPDLDKLREELQALRDEISKPEHEESLRLSPVEELEYKSFHEDPPASQHPEIDLYNVFSQLHEPQEPANVFDDELDEQLLILSQQVEKEMVRSEQKKFTFKKFPVNNPLNDSLDDIFQTIPDIPTEPQQSKSTDAVLRPGKVEFHRTQSYEKSNINDLRYLQNVDIERNRQEAVARLKSKTKTEAITPMQYSQEEIELKRQEALAKREAKRQQESIEKKRQEALKRLEMNRRKNAAHVKSSLVNRLN